MTTSALRLCLKHVCSLTGSKVPEMSRHMQLFAVSKGERSRSYWVSTLPYTIDVLVNLIHRKFANASAPAEKKEKPQPIMDGTTKVDDTKAKRAPRQKPRLTGPLPTLKWTKLRTNLSVDDAENRMHIREFVLRFFSKALPKAHLEELEHINGNGRNRYDEDEIVPWISDACLKSIVLAFLSVLAEEETNETIKKVR